MRRTVVVIAASLALGAAGTFSSGLAFGEGALVDVGAIDDPAESAVAGTDRTAVSSTDLTALEGAAPSAAAASAPATRISPPPELTNFFPMDPSPRCDILDNFGDARSGGRSHQGVDILATLGQPVLAVADGMLTVRTLARTTSSSSLSGNAWTLAANDGTTYFYAHLLGFADGLDVGSFVQAGQVIGYVGDTGNPGAGNYHLHFEIHPGGNVTVNPLPMLDVPVGCKVF